MVSEDFKKQVNGFGLTTARFWYTHPDYPDIINPHWLLWQEYDLCPKFPALFKYLQHLQTLDGKPAIVQVSHSRLIKPAEIRAVNGEFRLH